MALDSIELDEPSSPANKHKIVVGVDDTPDNLSLLSRIVVNAGYTFFGATSGAECLALVARVVPQLILLDIQMSEMDGFETCRQLRADMRFTHVPIAFITARQSVEDVRTGMAAGGNDFIVKPFDHEKFVERLSYWTRRRVNKGW
jgi:two-component system OmpR family response regulator